jgi:hypothetical protein
MSSFKNQVASDIGVFLNENEFADKHVIDDHEVIAIIDESVDVQHPLGYVEGVSLIQKTLYVSVSELGYRPEEGQWLVLNGQRLIIKHIGDEDGVLVIKLEANEA